jgi:hypothetical protein
MQNDRRSASIGLTGDIAAALAAIPEDDLRSLSAELYREAALAPDLMLWLVAAAGWELERRAGRRADDLTPCATSDEAEVECNLVALAILRVSFSSADPVVALLDVAADVLCASANRPQHGWLH